MNRKLEKIMQSRTFIIVLILFFICMSLLLGTYAWFTWNSTENTSLTMTIGEMADVTFTSGNDINTGLTPVFNYYDGVSTSFSVTNRGSIEERMYYTIILNITSIDDPLISKDVMYAIVKNNTLVKTGNLSTASNGNSITMYSTFLDAGTTNYVIYLYIDGNVENDTSIMNSTIIGNIMVESETSAEITLIDYITKLYSSNSTLITQETTNDTYYYSYQDADKTWGLMNDGLKVDTTQDATTTGLASVVTNTTSLTSGTEGNIRYFGPSDSVNNYIYFNCSDYSNQSDSTCEKWRIIGIVDGKVKIIRSDSIGDLAWDRDKNQDSSLTTYSNNWETSSLQLMLNSSYYNGDTAGTITYYSDTSEGTTATSLDMSTLGIKNDTTRNMISESIWYLGGYSSASLYSNEIYIYERTNTIGTTIYSGNPFTITANIGLMSLSDYGYGTDLTKCSDYLSAYNSSTDSYACRTNNWLFNGARTWLITTNSSDDYRVWLVVEGQATTYGGYRGYVVLPVLYLNSELVIESEGEGTSTNPYRISAS